MSVSQAALLRDYQATGSVWLRDTTKQYKAALLADDMGLGKSRQALTAAQLIGAERTLIVCPAGARRVWTMEIARWMPQWADRLFIIEPGTNQTLIRERLADPAPLVMVVGYSELSFLDNKLAGYLRAYAWDVLILDEAHYLKNISNRTQAIYGTRGDATGLQSSCRYVFLLTGTPTPNNASELFQHIRTFWPQLIFLPKKGRPMVLTEFEERYARYRDTVYGRKITGSQRQPELRAALAPVVLRRRKEEVLTELPPLRLQDIPLDQAPDVEQMSHASLQLAGRLAWSLTSATDQQLLTALRQPDGALTTLRRELGEAKVKATIAWIHERMSGGGKMLVFAWHLSVIEHLVRGLGQFSPTVIIGATTPVGRAVAIDRFQNRPECRLFIGQILAAGTAITLTAATEVAIVEPSWVPGENVEAICRAHRLGQRDSVLASFLFLPGTLDERVMTTFRRKAAEIAELQGDNLYANNGNGQFPVQQHAGSAGADAAHPDRRG